MLTLVNINTLGVLALMCPVICIERGVLADVIITGDALQYTLLHLYL